MKNERKIELLNYLYPNEKIRQFMCNELYVELSNIISNSSCISTFNVVAEKRKEDFEKVSSAIKEFLLNNPYYLQTIAKFYHRSEIDKIVEDIVIGYTFYLSNTVAEFSNIDIFKDKRSICYSTISIIDIL